MAPPPSVFLIILKFWVLLVKQSCWRCLFFGHFFLLCFFVTWCRLTWCPCGSINVFTSVYNKTLLNHQLQHASPLFSFSGSVNVKVLTDRTGPWFLSKGNGDTLKPKVFPVYNHFLNRGLNDSNTWAKIYVASLRRKEKFRIWRFCLPMKQAVHPRFVIVWTAFDFDTGLQCKAKSEIFCDRVIALVQLSVGI